VGYASVRFNPDTGALTWDVEPLQSSPYYSENYGNDTGYDLEGLCFKVDDVKSYEESHPEVFYLVVDPNSLPVTEVSIGI
jgi:hypothetical protein